MAICVPELRKSRRIQVSTDVQTAKRQTARRLHAWCQEQRDTFFVKVLDFFGCRHSGDGTFWKIMKMLENDGKLWTKKIEHDEHMWKMMKTMKWYYHDEHMWNSTEFGHCLIWSLLSPAVGLLWRARSPPYSGFAWLKQFETEGLGESKNGVTPKKWWVLIIFPQERWI